MVSGVTIVSLVLTNVALLLWNAKLHGENYRLRMTISELKRKFLQYQNSVRLAVKESKINH